MLTYLILGVILITAAFAVARARARRRWQAIMDGYADRQLRMQSGRKL
jgi:hypothetical protein